MVGAVLVQVLGFAAIVSSVVRSWPQVARIAVRNDVAGVSVLSWALSLGCGLSWIIYAAGVGVAPPLIANALTGVGVVAILVLVVRKRPSSMATAVRVVASVVALDVVVWLTFGASAVGVVAAGVSIVQFVPQAVRIVRSDVSGVSPATWWLVAGSSMIWGTYGLVSAQWVLVVGTFVVVPSAAVILLRIAFQRGMRAPTGSGGPATARLS